MQAQMITKDDASLRKEFYTFMSIPNLESTINLYLQKFTLIDKLFKAGDILKCYDETRTLRVSTQSVLDQTILKFSSPRRFEKYHSLYSEQWFSELNMFYQKLFLVYEHNLGLESLFKKASLSRDDRKGIQTYLDENKEIILVLSRMDQLKIFKK